MEKRERCTTATPHQPPHPTLSPTSVHRLSWEVGEGGGVNIAEWRVIVCTLSSGNQHHSLWYVQHPAVSLVLVLFCFFLPWLRLSSLLEKDSPNPVLVSGDTGRKYNKSSVLFVDFTS